MSLLTILNIIYVLVAIAMTAFILVQRGAGAQAGSGFGAGASATVFGARGASNFLTKSTAVLATLFFVLSLGMGIYVSRSGMTRGTGAGVMDGAPIETAPAPSTTLEVPAPAAVTVPAAPAGDVPVAPVQGLPVPPVQERAPLEPPPPEPKDDAAEGGGTQ